jgi:hypothetical protein
MGVVRGIIWPFPLPYRMIPCFFLCFFFTITPSGFRVNGYSMSVDRELPRVEVLQGDYNHF